MSLWQLPVNQSAIISDFQNNLHEAYVNRLHLLGLFKGEKVICLRKAIWGGPKVFQVGTALIAIERDMAEKVLVIRDSK